MKSCPVRLQLSRKGGFNLQEQSRGINGLAAVRCARPGPLGNPAKVAEYFLFKGGGEDFLTLSMPAANATGDPGDFQLVADSRTAVDIYARMLAAGWGRRRLDHARGYNLACWCRLCSRHAATGKPFDEPCSDCAPCHTDVLGARANGFVCEAVT